MAKGEGGGGPVRPHVQPWIGFIHVPPLVPAWFQSEQSNQRVFTRKPWRTSLKHCRGLFTLSEYHRRYLEQTLRPNFPISALRHPAEFPEVGFDMDRYRNNPRKRLVQVGWWLRRLYAISKVKAPLHTPTLLGSTDWSKNLVAYAERRIHRLTDAISVDVIDFLENEAYDDLLSENLVFIDLYDTSANNTVIESIARGTPIVVCRHPAVEEYLGSDYPLLFDELDQVPKLLMDASRIEAAHQMLKQDEIRRPLRIGYFADAFARSDVVQHAVE